MLSIADWLQVLDKEWEVNKNGCGDNDYPGLSNIAKNNENVEKYLKSVITPLFLIIWISWSYDILHSSCYF